jgi:BirA family biotin operon repressor/biotin-[acetyl-CoA-carboxylase] ligase
VSGIAWRLRILSEAPSTSDMLAALAAEGAPEGTAILARRQTAGRGRAGRGWDSPAGNLHLSVLLRPAAPLRDVPLFGLAAAAALADASAAALPPGAPVGLKWPNDLLLGGAKAGGILAEATGEDGRIAHLILGIGVNLSHAPALPDRPTACFAAFGPPPEPVGFAGVLLDALARRLGQLAAEGFAPIREAWLARGPAPGAPVTVRGTAAPRSGRFAGLAPDGSLLLDEDGGCRAIAAGEVGA